MRAGTVVPATAGLRAEYRETVLALNEGRDRSPGDSYVVVGLVLRAGHRSMRAGTVVPATVDCRDHRRVADHAQ